VFTAVTLVGQATAGVVNAIESRKLPTVGLPPAELMAPNENLRRQAAVSAESGVAQCHSSSFRAW
jgi:hypothetical protein